MPDLSKPNKGGMRECLAGDSKVAQKECVFFESNRDERCLNQRFGEFCPYYDTIVLEKGGNADTRY